MNLPTQLTNPVAENDVAYQRGLQERLTGLAKRESPSSVALDYVFTERDTIDSLQVDATAKAITITLPPPNGTRRRRIIKTDASGNAVTVSGNGYLINGASTVVLATRYVYVQLEPTGTGWLIVDQPELSSGTVTSVSVTTANGVSGSVATPTTTPAITITLGAITPTSVAASGAVTGSNLSGTNTGDQTNIAGNAGTATKLATPRTIGGSNFDGSANVTSFPAPGPFGGTTPNSVAATTISATGVVDLSAAGAGQIAFPATQNSSAGANVLDDYEEGTWTPSLGGNTTYLAQLGTYTKIGRQVYIWGHLQVNTLGTGSTTVISGLPFAPMQISAGSIAYFANLAVNVVGFFIYGVNATTTLQFGSTTAAAASMNNVVAVFGNGTDIYFAMTYNV